MAVKEHCGELDLRREGNARLDVFAQLFASRSHPRRHRGADVYDLTSRSMSALNSVPRYGPCAHRLSICLVYGCIP